MDREKFEQKLVDSLREGTGLLPEPYRGRLRAHDGVGCEWELRNGALWCVNHDLLLAPSPTEYPTLVDGEEAVRMAERLRKTSKELRAEYEQGGGQRSPDSGTGGQVSR